jgi:tetratricopeptide (TPR) repeat protein
MMAKLWLRANQVNAARPLLERAAVERPDLPEVFLVFGRLALAEGRMTDAWLQFEHADQLARAERFSREERREIQHEAAVGLAAVAEMRADWSSLAGVLAAWAKREPGNARVHYHLGQALFRAGQRDQAADELARAFQLDSALAPPATVIGRLYSEQKNDVKAEQWLEKGAREEPKNAAAHQEYAIWLIDHNRAEAAKREADVAAALQPDSDDVQALRGVIAFGRKNYEKAEQIFEQLHLKRPGSFTASNHLALALAQQDDEAKRNRAMQFAELNVRLHPDSGEAFATWGIACFQLKRMDEAEKALRVAVAKGSVPSDGVYILARVLAHRNKQDESQRWLRRALDAPGRFAFREEAQAWADELNRGGGK